ncbi:unnamed protein product [Wuchereria bancrofti]|uniref:Uncharacterized protein n=1 Tax=Wuchereria bancrofti TaxID=6293 RepID=A0A3P7E9L1_WUCBA|nr:unnamed protein product [Wuchereria bancrofti]
MDLDVALQRASEDEAENQCDEVYPGRVLKLVLHYFILIFISSLISSVSYSSYVSYSYFKI